jgi:putative transposase
MFYEYVRKRKNIRRISNVYALYLYFLGQSFRNTSKALEPFEEKKRSYVAVWSWVQRFNPKIIYCRKTRVAAFIIDR